MATTEDQSPIVEVKNVSFKYPESDLRVAAPPGFIANVSLAVNRKERILLLGQNGSGKSTLLSLIAGKHQCGEGKITVDGKDSFDDTTLNTVVSLIGPPWPPEAFFNSTVSGVTSPCPDETRRNEIAREIHLPLKAPIDKMSAGEKRRVQILFGMVHPAHVILLDECSTDIDVVERVTVLDRCRRECEERGACCIYATHILDGISQWASHIALMEQGKLVQFFPAAQLHGGSLITFAHKFMAKADIIQFPTPPAVEGAVETRKPIVTCKNLTFRHVLKDASFEIHEGSRTLLIGCNGAGKSTILNMMGSKQFFPNKEKELVVCDTPVFQDMSLNKVVALCGDWWPVVPGGEVHVREMVPIPLTPRAEKLAKMLAINLDWDCRCVSAGELKRIQLFFKMYHEKKLVLLDEATADLDIDQRHMLLRFLYEENIEWGVTVVYATHIFEGLGSWATDCLVVDSNVQGIYGAWKAPIQEEAIMKTLIKLKSEEKWEL